MQDPSALQYVFVVIMLVVVGWISGWRFILTLGAVTEDVGVHDDVNALLGRAASEMAAQPPGQEAAEVGYLLEALGHRTDRDTYRQVLEAVQGDVAARLQEAKL